MLRLKRPFLGHSKVVRLLISQRGQLHTKLLKVQTSYFFIQVLGQEVHAQRITLGVVPQFDLGQHLVGEGGTHHEAAVTGGAAQVHQAATGQQDDFVAVGELEEVDLRLDVGFLDGVLFEPRDVDFDVEVTDVADDGFVFHLHEVLTADDAFAAGGGDEDVATLHDVLHGGDLEAFHGSLQGVNGVDLGDDDASTHALQGVGAALADVAVSGNHGGFAGDHHVGGSLEAVDQGLAAAVQVVELGLGDRVVDVDGGSHQLAFFETLDQVVNAGCGFLGDAFNLVEHLGITVVDDVGEVSTVVQDHVGNLTVFEGLELLLDAPVVLFFGLAFPGEHGDTGSSDSGGGVVLSAVDVARGPGDFSAELDEGLDQYGGLDRHVQTSGDAGAGERLVLAITLTESHQAGHFFLGQTDFLAAEIGLRDVSYFEVFGYYGQNVSFL